MLPTLKTNNRGDDVNKNGIKIDFGVVPVGSVHKRTIDITNDLKASIFFFQMPWHMIWCALVGFNLKINYFPL